jgi:hypothetical protein
MDINLDGADDIAIGAPAYDDMFESPINYNVRETKIIVYIIILFCNISMLVTETY